MEERTVKVRRGPQDYKIASYRVEDVRDPRWDTVTGGVQRPTGRPTLFAYVSCDAMLEGELAHSCRHGSGPHGIKVCITKTGNDPDIWQEFAAKADEHEVKRHAAKTQNTSKAEAKGP